MSESDLKRWQEDAGKAHVDLNLARSRITDLEAELRAERARADKWHDETYAALGRGAALEDALAAATARAEAAERERDDVRRWADAVPTESLRRIFEAWQMGGQALQHDIDAVFGWLAQQGEVQP